MNRRGQAIAISTALLGIAVLIAVGVAGKDRIREEWYLWRLEKGDEREQMAAAEKLLEMMSARTTSELVAAFRMIARKVAKHPPADALHLRDLGPYAELWGRLHGVLIQVGKSATPDLLRGAADEDNVAVAMCMVGALLEIHGYPTSGGHPLSRSRPTYPGELVLRQLRDDLSNPHETRQLASEVLKRWFSAGGARRVTAS